MYGKLGFRLESNMRRDAPIGQMKTISVLSVKNNDYGKDHKLSHRDNISLSPMNFHARDRHQRNSKAEVRSSFSSVRKNLRNSLPGLEDTDIKNVANKTLGSGFYKNQQYGN